MWHFQPLGGACLVSIQFASKAKINVLLFFRTERRNFFKINTYIDFRLWGNFSTTHTHIFYCSIFPFLAHCDNVRLFWALGSIYCILSIVWQILDSIHYIYFWYIIVLVAVHCTQLLQICNDVEKMFQASLFPQLTLIKKLLEVLKQTKSM